MSCTIYLLTNKINSKIYIGQTWLSLNKRMGPGGHNYSNSPYLYNAMLKYGSDNFEYTVLSECDTQEQADILEEENINKYNSRDHETGYNIKEGGSHGKHSEETKKKMSESQMGEKSPWFGKHLTEETKQKLSESMSGRTLSPEHRAKVIKTLIEAPHTGCIHSEEAKAKISEKNTGRKHSPESVKQRALKRMMPREREDNIIQSYKNLVPIKEIMAKFETSQVVIYRVLKRNNIPLNGREHVIHGKHTEETKQKMSDARKKYWSELETANNSSV